MLIEDDAREQPDLEEQGEHESNYETVDIEQGNEGAVETNTAPRDTRPQRERRPPTWLQDYET